MQKTVNLGMVLWFCILAALWISCSTIFPTDSEQACSVQVEVRIAGADPALDQVHSLSKQAAIVKVSVTITAADMKTLNLDLQGSGGNFTGSIAVPKGNDRTFTVRAADGAGVVQYQGSTTSTLTADKQSVSITLTPEYPAPVVLSASGTTANSVILSWSKSKDVDFDHYTILRSLTSSLNLNDTNQRLIQISDKNTNSYTDAGLTPNTKYYYQIWTVDTESLANGSNVLNVTTARPATFTFTVKNPIYTDIHIMVSGQGSSVIVPNDSLTIVFSTHPGSVKYYAYTYGETAEGTQLGEKLEWDYTIDVTGKSSYSTQLIYSSKYFFLYMKNTGTHTLNPVFVNYGLTDVKQLNISIPADGTKYEIGYFMAYANTQVRGYYEDGTHYTYWIQGSQFTLPFVQNQFIELSNTFLSRAMVLEEDGPVLSAGQQMERLRPARIEPSRQPLAGGTIDAVNN